MTRKSIENQLDKALDIICQRAGLDPRVEAKGGERELANAALYGQLRQALPGLIEGAIAAAGGEKADPTIDGGAAA